MPCGSTGTRQAPRRPTAEMPPSSTTATRSQVRTTPRRCATMTVRPAQVGDGLVDLHLVLGSAALVASSRMSTGASLRMARAMAMLALPARQALAQRADLGVVVAGSPMMKSSTRLPRRYAHLVQRGALAHPRFSRMPLVNVFWNTTADAPSRSRRVAHPPPCAPCPRSHRRSGTRARRWWSSPRRWAPRPGARPAARRGSRRAAPRACRRS